MYQEAILRRPPQGARGRATPRGAGFRSLLFVVAALAGCPPEALSAPREVLRFEGRLVLDRGKTAGGLMGTRTAVFQILDSGLSPLFTEERAIEIGLEGGFEVVLGSSGPELDPDAVPRDALLAVSVLDTRRALVHSQVFQLGAVARALRARTAEGFAGDRELDLNGRRIEGLGWPMAGDHAATRDYVDATGANLLGGLASHVADLSIHFPASEIRIDSAQVVDFEAAVAASGWAARRDNPHEVTAAQVAYTPAPSGLAATDTQAALDELASAQAGVAGALASHASDSSRHFTIAEISISAAQVVGLDGAIDSSSFAARRDNPHRVSARQVALDAPIAGLEASDVHGALAALAAREPVPGGGGSPAPGPCRTVAVPGGPSASQNGASLLAVLAGIQDASATCRVEVRLSADTYDIGSSALWVRPFVDLVGAGRGRTRVSGAGQPGNVGTVQCDSQAGLRDLDVENMGGDDRAVALAIPGTSPVVERITAFATGGTDRIYPIYVGGTANPTLRGVVAEAFGTTHEMAAVILDGKATGIITGSVLRATAGAAGFIAFGLYCNGANPEVSEVEIEVQGSTRAIGIFNVFDGSPSVARSRIEAAGGSVFSTAIQNESGSSPSLYDVTATASGAGQAAVGIKNFLGSQPRISSSRFTGQGAPVARGMESGESGAPAVVRAERSSFAGATAAVQTDGTYRLELVACRLVGGAPAGAGVVTCNGCLSTP